MVINNTPECLASKKINIQNNYSDVLAAISAEWLERQAIIAY